MPSNASFQFDVVSGNHKEIYEIVYSLYPPNGDQPRVSATDACRVTFKITVSDATGVSPSQITEYVDLNAGETQVIEFNFSEFAEDSRSQVILMVSERASMGSCTLLMGKSRFEESTGDTLTDPTILRPVEPDVIDRH